MPTFWTFSCRFCAVTTISPLSTDWSSSADCAACGAASCGACWANAGSDQAMAKVPAHAQSVILVMVLMVLPFASPLGKVPRCLCLAGSCVPVSFSAHFMKASELVRPSEDGKFQ